MVDWPKIADKQPKNGGFVWVLNGRTKRPVLRRFVVYISDGEQWIPGGPCRPTDLWCQPEPPAMPKMDAMVSNYRQQLLREQVRANRKSRV